MSIILINFTIPGKPQALERARTSKGRFYTPKKSVDAKNKVALFAKQAFNKHRVNFPIPKDVEIEIDLLFLRKRKATSKPDLDNYVKLVLDALHVIYEDDSQVVRVEGRKKQCDEEMTTITLSCILPTPSTSGDTKPGGRSEY